MGLNDPKVSLQDRLTVVELGGALGETQHLGSEAIAERVLALPFGGSESLHKTLILASTSLSAKQV